MSGLRARTHLGVPEPLKTPVAICRCDSYVPKEVDRALRRLMSLIGADALLPKEGRVLVKPNMLSPVSPERAVTTHPEVVFAVAKYLSERCEHVDIGDSPGRGEYPLVCETTRITDAAHRSGASIVSFEEEVPTKHLAGHVCKEFPLARPVVSSAALVNVAKMKTHGLMTFTGAVKNLYGCVSGARKAHLHFRYQEPEDFGQMIADLVELVKPAISILDAILGMDGEGPSHGRPRNVGLLMASPDPVALDVVAMHVAMADPMTVPYLKACRKHGVGETNLENIDILGERLREVQIADFLMPERPGSSPLTFRWAGPLRKELSPIPMVSPKLCERCGQCAASCPPKAMTVSDSGVTIQRKLCIKCYCCQELCPSGAISLKKRPLARLAEAAADLIRRHH